MPRVKIKVTKKNIKGSTSRKKKAAIKIQRATRRRIINQKKKKSDEKKKKALDKINKATRRLKKKQEECPICLEKIDKKERTETNCGHFFHKKCIKNWCIEKTRQRVSCKCPVCKKNLPEIQNLAKKYLEKKLKEQNKPRELSAFQLRMMETIDREYEESMVEINRRREELRRELEALEESSSDENS